MNRLRNIYMINDFEEEYQVISNTVKYMKK